MKFISIINIQLICQIILPPWEKDYTQSHSPAEFHMKENYSELLLLNSKGNYIWQGKHSDFLDTIIKFYSFCGGKSTALSNEQSILKDWSLLTFLCIFRLILVYVLTGGKKLHGFTPK